MSTLPDTIQPMLEELQSQAAALEKALEPGQNDPAIQIKSVVIGVHKALLRIIAINHAQRQDRLVVMKGLLGKLEGQINV